MGHHKFIESNTFRIHFIADWVSCMLVCTNNDNIIIVSQTLVEIYHHIAIIHNKRINIIHKEYY